MSPKAFSGVLSFPPDRACLEEITIQQNRAIPARTVHVYKYQPNHREAVRRLCCDTGFLGNPIDPIYLDREMYADLHTRPYLDYESDWALIAKSDGQVVGYLLGSVSPHFQKHLMFCGLQTTARMVARWLKGKYADHPRSARFVRWVLTKGLKELSKSPKDAAHLHLNLYKSWRGGLVAKRLLIIFEDMLRVAGVENYYAQFFSCPERHPVQVYTRYGFSLFDRCLTTVFQPEFPYTLFNVCLIKRLNGKHRRQV